MTWLRFLIPAFAFLSVFFFPWPVTLVLIFIAALCLPVLGLALGAFADLIYFNAAAAGVPSFLIMGLVATLVALLVHRFVKTRIME